MLPLWLGTSAIVSQLLTCPWSYQALQEMNLPALALTAGISGHFILGHLLSFPCSAPGNVCLLSAHGVTRWLLMSNYNLSSPPCTCAPWGSPSLTHLYVNYLNCYCSEANVPSSAPTAPCPLLAPLPVNLVSAPSLQTASPAASVPLVAF